MQSLWMLFATFVFAIMGVCVKFASNIYSAAEIVAYRGAISALFILSLVLLRGGTFKTTLPWHHLWRGTVGVIALWLWFHSFSALPLAIVVTLNYTSSIWIAVILLAIGWWRGTKHGEWALVGAILLSFVGVILLLQPAVQMDQWRSALLALGSGFLAALAYLQVRKLGHMGEPEYRVVFYFSLTSIVAGVLIATTAGLFNGQAVAWHAHSGRGLALLLAIGVTGTVAQVAMTRAYRLGNALVSANLQYMGIVFASLNGILLWNDKLGWAGWSGVGLILISGVASTFLSGPRSPQIQTPTEALGDAIASEI
jgi:S-adenosylmethionine uptake transporter